MADPKHARPARGKPEQALSGGGSDTRAGSEEGGSAYGDDREDDEAEARPAKPDGGGKPAPE